MTLSFLPPSFSKFCCCSIPGIVSRAHSLASENIRFEEVGSDVQTLELPKGEIWPAVSHSKLFVRAVYRKYYDKFINGHRSSEDNKTIVCGTPGIGKSAAGMYFLHRALHEGKTVIYRALHQEVCTIYDQFSQTRIPFDSPRPSELLENPTTLLITDGVPPPSQCGCAVVLITSPKHNVWYPFSKDPNCKQHFFPLPTLAEMKLMREHCFPKVSEDEMLEGIRLFGVNPRAVFNKFAQKKWSESDLRTLVETEVRVELLVAAQRMDSTGKDDPSHRLIFIRATDDFRDGGREFASDFVLELVYEKLVRDENDKFQAWLQHAGAAPEASEIRGRLFERVSIHIIARGGTFDTMDMVTGVHQKLTFPVRRVRAGDVLPQALPPDILLRAPNAKYAAIDGIAWDSGLLSTFNASVNPKHSVLMLDATQQHGLVRLQEKYQLVGGSCQHYLLLPDDKFPDVKKLTPGQYKWNDPGSIFKEGKIPENFTKKEKVAKQKSWGFSAVSIPLGKSNGAKRHYSTLRTVIRRCLL